jgi:hypothetical protein
MLYVLSGNLLQFHFGEFPHHPLEMNIPRILNGDTNRYAVDVNHMSMEVRQLVHLYLITNQEIFNVGTRGQ